MYTTIQVGKADRRTGWAIAFTAQPVGRAAAGGRADVLGEAGEVTVFADQRRILIGLGKPEELTPRRVRAAGGLAVAQLFKLKAASAVVSISNADAELMPAGDFAKAFAEGLMLGSFVYDAFKAGARKEGPRKLVLDAGDAAANRQMQRGLDMAAGANYARRLAATPPNVANPAYIAAEAKKLARETGLKCTVYAGKELERRGFVGIANVGRASQSPPCLIELVYTPGKRASARKAAARRGDDRPLVLIGKTITFDSGGLSVKINHGMRHMKYDKCGGMAVLGAMRQIAAMKPDRKIVALLPAAENLISSTSYRPDDILRYANGVTVEVTNTDAEGRLVLADALVHACRAHRAGQIVELSTLTGGVVVALGNVTAGYWCNDEALAGGLERASYETGEAVWRMPIMPEHREALKSEHADIVNSTNKPVASSCMGAAFLERFVDEGVAWAHIDIAGAAVAEGPMPPFAVGPTGFGARLLMELVDGQQR